MIVSSDSDIKSFDGQANGGAATFFAPPERASAAALIEQAHRAVAEPLLAPLFDSLLEMALLLNRERQIVFANRAFREGTGPNSVLGLRPGEAIGCLHAYSDEAPNGCGTSHACRSCGAVLAILASQRTGSGHEEVRIVRHHESEALNLSVRTRQITLQQEPFTMFVVEDVSDQRRREELEHGYFQDVLEIAGSLRDLVARLPTVALDERPCLQRQIIGKVSNLIAETDARRLVAKAERNELSCTFTLVDGRDMLEACGAAAASDRIAIDPACESALFETDWNLASRILSSMIKDMLGAAPPEGSVTLGCRRDGDEVQIRVCHPGQVPALAAPRMFDRSSFANPRSRELATQGLRIIVEKYLKGRLCLASSDAEGTVFTIAFPGARSPRAAP